MGFPEWSLIAGSVISIALAIGPWMFKVHAKLAVIASRLDDLCATMIRGGEEHARLRELTNRHQSRLDTHDVQIVHISERLRGE